MNQQVNQFFHDFIQDTITLKALIADYNSSIINFNAGTKQETEEKTKEAINQKTLNLELTQQAAYINILNLLRRTSFSLKTDLDSFKKHLNLSEKELKEINENYTEIETVFQPDLKKCKAFLQKLNDIKVKYINIEAMIITQEKEQLAIDAMKTPKGVTLD